MELSYAGEYLKSYKPPIFNVNATINWLLTKPTTYKPSAIITREVQFPDASFYQKEIDFEVMRQNTKAIIIRAGQNLWIDDQFERNYAEAKRVGLYVGVYWFYDGRKSPAAQADILITLLQNKTLEMEVFIDWEKNYGGAYEGLQNVVAMMQRVEAAGLRIKGIGIYTGYYFFRANSNPVTNANQYAYLKNKPLWEAWYTSNPSNVLIPAPWSYLTHWQFGTPVVMWGQQTLELDMNFYNGSAQNFHNIYGGTQPPNGGTMPKYYQWTATAANIRAGAGSGYADKGDIRNLDVIQVDNPKSGSWFPFSLAQHSDGSWVTLADGTPLDGTHGTFWVTDAYFVEVGSLPNPPAPPPPPPPTTTLPSYLIAYDEANNPLGRYNLQP